MDEIGDPSLIGVGAARVTKNPRELLIARRAADVIEHSGYFKDGFSMQTGSGAASTAATRFLEERMSAQGHHGQLRAGWDHRRNRRSAQEGADQSTVVDVQSFDRDAAESLRDSRAHLEISANEYANPTSKAAYVDRVDVVILSALEIDLDFNVNVITGSDGVMRGASGGHCDVAAAANLTIIVAPLVRGRIPTVVRRVSDAGHARRVGRCIGDRPGNCREPEAPGSGETAARRPFAGDDASRSCTRKRWR